MVWSSLQTMTFALWLCHLAEVSGTSYPSFQSSHVLKQYGLVSSPWNLFYSHETLIFSSILWYINISAKFCSLFNTTHKSLMTPPLRMTLLEEPLCCVRIYSIKLPRKTTLQLALIVYRVNPHQLEFERLMSWTHDSVFFFFSSQTMRVGYTIKHELVLASIVSIIFILINTRTRGK